MSQDLDKLIDKIIDNADDDRNEINAFIEALLVEAESRAPVTNDLLGQKIQTLKNHEVSVLLVKQYEAKLKSNEQLIKIASILQKREASLGEEDPMGFDRDKFYAEEEDEGEELVGETILSYKKGE